MSEARVAVTSRWRVSRDLAFDLALFAAGAVLGVVVLARWLAAAPDLDVPPVAAVLLVVVMSRYPLTLPQRAGDAVIGFEISALVFLVLAVPPDEALGLWCIGQTVAQLIERARSWRSRLFNIGITVLCGGLFVLTYDLGGRYAPALPELAVIAVACAVFFVADLVVTTLSLALEAAEPLKSALVWRAVALPLLIFLSVSTLGYLAALLQRSQADWTMLLLLVPVGTILVAAKSISDARLTSMRLRGLFDAATRAPEWTDEHHIEAALVEQAQEVFRHSTATLSDQPVQSHKERIASVITVEGRPHRWLVVERPPSHGGFDDPDHGALDMLAAMAAATLERRRLLDEMSHLARHDVLTGLANRAVFADRLDHALSYRRHHGLAVLYCDLDGFKAVNDRYGHQTGDALLKAVAERLRVCVRPSDTLARLGGDEFAVLLEEFDGKQDAHQVAQRVLDALSKPFTVESQVIRVRTSVGIAHGQQGLSASDLMRNADTAMYRAKALGRDRAEVFESSMQAENLRRIELQDELRRALEQRQVTFAHQPVVSLATGRIEGVELLARWRHPQLGHIGPDVFVPLAEQMGLGLSLVEQAFAAARLAAVELGRAAARPLAISVNLTPDQATDARVLDMVSAMRAAHHDVPLILEITEGTLLVDDQRTLEALDALADTGAQLAVDDFGVGYSSIGYLHRFPVRILKIDKSFVRDCHEPRTRPLVEGVIAMARTMGLLVVAEGIEDWGTARRIRDMGCQLGQGYLFARPVPLDEVLDVVRAGAIDVAPADGVHVLPRPRLSSTGRP